MAQVSVHQSLRVSQTYTLTPLTPLLQYEVIQVWDTTHVHLQWAVYQQKIQADQRCRPFPTLRPEQRVWLSTQDLRLHLPCRKLSPRYVSPFKIINQVNAVTYMLLLPSHYLISPTFHVSLLSYLYFCLKHNLFTTGGIRRMSIGFQVTAYLNCIMLISLAIYNPACTACFSYWLLF